MSFARETYYAALWDRLSTLTGFATMSRRVRLLETMAAAELPALYMTVGKQTVTWPTRGDPPKHVLGATIYVYAGNPDPNISADIQLNGLLDAVQAALQPSPATGIQTLGLPDVHTVEWGPEIEVFAGPNGQRAAAIANVAITVFDDF